MIAAAACAAAGAAMLGCMAAFALPAYAWLCVLQVIWGYLNTPTSSMSSHSPESVERADGKDEANKHSKQPVEMVVDDMHHENKMHPRKVISTHDNSPKLRAAHISAQYSASNGSSNSHVHVVGPYVADDGLTSSSSPAVPNSCGKGASWHAGGGAPSVPTLA